jgi:hypothetical protein
MLGEETHVSSRRPDRSPQAVRFLFYSWYLATMILRRAARPFRYFEPDWRPRVGQMVAAAEGALDT